MPGLAAEEARKHQHAGVDHLADAERDHGERGAGALRRHVAEEHAEGEPGEPAEERQERQRRDEGALPRQVQRVHVT
jgi:hypothetical protein